MVAEHEFVEAERRAGNGGVDCAAARPVADVEGVATAAALDLVLLAAADEVVVGGVDREQDAQVPFGIGVEHDQVAVVLGPHVDLGAVPSEETPVVVDPDLDRRIVRARGGRPIGASREEEWKEQSVVHWAPPGTAVAFLETVTGHCVRLVLRQDCEPRATVHLLESVTT